MKKAGKYPGDAAMARYLEKHGCPRSFAVVRMRFLGEAASPKFGVQPSRVIEQVWNDHLPTFEGEDEARAFFATMITLWNRMARCLTGVLVKLSKPKKLKTFDDVAAAMRMRADEISDGFLAGFGTGEEPGEPLAIPKAVAGLAALAEQLTKAAERLEEGKGAEDDLDPGHYIQALDKATREVEGLMTAIIKTRGALQSQTRGAGRQP